MRVLFINLSDMGVIGEQEDWSTNPLGHKGAEALRKREDVSEVTLVELLPTVLHDQENDIEIPSADAIAHAIYLQHADFDINTYDQIIIAAHDVFNDADHCYYQLESSEAAIQLFSSEQLAEFFNRLLTGCGFNEGKLLNILCAICYAARPANCLPGQARELTTEDFRTRTFSGKFVNAFLIFDHSFVLTAYAGAMHFNKDTGRVNVETETRFAILLKGIGPLTENLSNVAIVGSATNSDQEVRHAQRLADMLAKQEEYRLEHKEVTYWCLGSRSKVLIVAFDPSSVSIPGSIVTGSGNISLDAQSLEASESDHDDLVSGRKIRLI